MPARGAAGGTCPSPCEEGEGTERWEGRRCCLRGCLLPPPGGAPGQRRPGHANLRPAAGEPDVGGSLAEPRSSKDASVSEH